MLAIMTPVIPCPVSFIPGTAFITRKRCLTRLSSSSSRSSKQTFSSKRLAFTSSTVLPQLRSAYGLRHLCRLQRLSATGTDVTVEEQDSSTADLESAGPPEVPSTSDDSSEEPSKKSDGSSVLDRSKRSRPIRKSEMPPVKNEDLVPGAKFTGKVRTIQPFGAFVDFGAFTDGLVHVSRLSDNFVKDVGSVVSIGQEVEVRLVEVNIESGRISLSMRENDEKRRPQQAKDVASSGDRSRPPGKPNQRKGDVKKVSKFGKGQDLKGTVKNLTRSGAFISLPEGEEGFLPASEEADDGFPNLMGGSSLEIGQEVDVRVLRVTRGQVTLTMKKEEDVQLVDAKLKQGVVHEATNPFFLAFRQNKDIAAFLDENEKLESVAHVSEEVAPDQAETVPDVPKDKGEPTINDETAEIVPTTVDDATDCESNVGQGLHEAVEFLEGDSELKSEDMDPKDTMLASDPVSSSESMVEETAVPDQNEDSVAKNEVQIPAPLEQKQDDLQSYSSGESSQIETTTGKEGVEVQTTSEDLDVPSAPSSEDQLRGSTSDNKDQLGNAPKADASEEVVKTQDISPESQVNKETSVEVGASTVKGDLLISPLSAENDTYAPSKKENDIANSNEPTENPSSSKSTPKATISPALVKQLREETGAGMMDCKKALAETGGDIMKAQEYLRKKGLASADKKASRATAEGRIGSYIHDSRIGILIEVNCETDFVSRGDIFKELVDDLAMQVAACPQVEYLVTEDVPKEFVDKEREIEMQKEDLSSKPEQIRSKIVEGRISKRLGELALLEQPFIKNDKVLVKDWVKQTIATIGENIKVKRFVRYNLGEGLEKKSQDFAAEVAAQTAANPSAASSEEQPSAVETKGPVEKKSTVAVSASLVKQLREETGAGMMDCKKALSETGGDLEKAQEYLRKKGLSTADKKSSRLAAEGRIGSYIHDSRIGVLIEVNCETDFVGRSERFKELVDDLAMQVVACPQVQYVSIEDIPEGIVKKEYEIEMQREDILSKPENIREKIVEGRVSKRLGELALLEQAFIKDDSILIKDLVKQVVAALGENIKVRRFARFTLGEETEYENSISEA